MRQCITEEQLQEVDYRKIVELTVENERNKNNLINSVGSEGEISGLALMFVSRYMTIGVLIKLINDNKSDTQELVVETLNGTYHLEIYNETSSEKFQIDKEVLIDALWEATKWILKEEGE